MDIPIQNATGFITARDVTSPIDVPPFDNSAMDGYAIKLNKDNYVYRITHIVQAGETRHLKIGDGEAARVLPARQSQTGQIQSCSRNSLNAMMIS